MISAAFFAFFSAVIPTRLLVGKQIYKIKSEVIYEQANDNQTALIQAAKCKSKARKMQTKVKTSREKKSTYKWA